MADQFTLDFTNGAASMLLPVGTYTYISNTIPGYRSGTVSGFEINSTTTEVNLTVTADGVLNITVQDSDGTPITAGKLRLSDGLGTYYSDEVDIVNGEVSFTDMPYDALAPIEYYIEQNGSDPTHFPIDAPQAVSADETPMEVTVLNERGFTVNFIMTESKYPGITPLSGEVSFTR